MDCIGGKGAESIGQSRLRVDKTRATVTTFEQVRHCKSHKEIAVLLAGTLLIVGLISGISTLSSIATGRGDDTTPDRDFDPDGHADSNRFGLWLSGALLVGALVSAIIGV